MKLAVSSTPVQVVYQQYVSARQALTSWEEAHQTVLEERTQLEEALRQAETALKTWAHTHHESITGKEVQVLYQTPRRRWYDPGVLRNCLSADLIKAVGLIETVERVNEKALAMLVTLGKIPETVAESAYREELLSPRVVLKSRILTPPEEE